MQSFILSGMAAYLHLIADSKEYCKVRSMTKCKVCLTVSKLIGTLQGKVGKGQSLKVFSLLFREANRATSCQEVIEPACLTLNM